MLTNVLHLGDNLDVLRTPEFVAPGSVDLIYLDPPFNSKRDYFVTTKDRGGSPSRAQQDAFLDTWTWSEEGILGLAQLRPGGEGLDRCADPRRLSAAVEAFHTMLGPSPMMAYLVSMTLRLVEMHRALSPTGSLYLHCDPTAGHYLKIVLDAIFGPERFHNEVVWQRSYGHGDSTRSMGRSHDTIFFYSKGPAYTLNRFYHEHDPEYVKSFFRHTDARGRYKLENLTSPNPRPNLVYEYKGYPSPEKGWRVNRQRMEQLDAEERLYFPAKKDGRIMKKVYLHELGGQPMTDVWSDIKPLSAHDKERLGYPTQKPLGLLERIICAGSNEGDIILDPYCGCGTTVTAAHKLGRRWIGIDVAPVAVKVMEDRLREHFSDLEKAGVPVIGTPRDLEGARMLFERDRHKFQQWACYFLLGARSMDKKGADKGVDGWLGFFDVDEKPHKAVVQVKGGQRIGPAEVRDFCHVVSREKATLGFFVCLAEETKAMREEALSMGMWQSASGAQYPRVQILPVGALLARTREARMPSQEKASVNGFRAKRQQRRGTQTDLLEALEIK